MCGIVGIAGSQDARWLTDMNSTACHRGPDNAGEYHDADSGIGLAMRRLSILDLAGGRQLSRCG